MLASEALRGSCDGDAQAQSSLQITSTRYGLLLLLLVMLPKHTSNTTPSFALAASPAITPPLTKRLKKSRLTYFCSRHKLDQFITGLSMAKMKKKRSLILKSFTAITHI